MKVNGVTKEIDPGRDTVPQILNDRTMAPVRFVAENFGYEVELNQKTETAIIK